MDKLSLPPRRLLTVVALSVCMYALGASCFKDKTIYEHSGYVSGTVTDSLSGQPLDSARITWGDTVGRISSLTDSNGTYVIQVPVPHPTVFARKEGYLTKWLEVSVTGTHTSGVDFQLTPN